MIIPAALYNTFILSKRLAILLLTLAIGLLPLLLSAQQIHDTLSVNTGDNGEYAVNRHLYIYKTNKNVSPGFISDSVKPAEFKQLSPANSFNDVQHPSNYYWLLLTVINNLAYDETFYYQLNHPQLYSVIAYIKDTGRFNSPNLDPILYTTL